MNNPSVFSRLPWMLVALRLGLGPVILGLAWLKPSAPAFATCLIIAFTSDYFDGVIARRLGVATEKLRRADSMADTVFYVCTAIAIYRVIPHALQTHWFSLAVLLALEIVRYGYDLRKFGKEAAYHMWSSKLWGVFLFFGAFSALVYESSGSWVALAIYWGIVADVEGLAISMALHRWQADVPSFWHARKLR